MARRDTHFQFYLVEYISSEYKSCLSYSAEEAKNDSLAITLLISHEHINLSLM